jgi:hypothetical protein
MVRSTSLTMKEGEIAEVIARVISEEPFCTRIIRFTTAFSKRDLPSFNAARLSLFLSSCNLESKPLGQDFDQEVDFQLDNKYSLI